MVRTNQEGKEIMKFIELEVEGSHEILSVRPVEIALVCPAEDGKGTDIFLCGIGEPWCVAESRVEVLQKIKG